MSNKRITDLTELTTPTTDDVFPVVDIATNTTTKVQLGNLPVPSSVTTALATKQNTLVSGTNIKTVNSNSLLGSGDIAVQETLVSGTNIKTINSTSLLGSGNITIAANPSGVSGAIQFSNGSAFASDASKLFWDDTNKRLGVGTNAPNTALEVKGVIRSTRSTSTNNISISAEDGRGRLISSTGIGIHLDEASTTVLLAINNAVTIGNNITELGAKLGIKGSGSTSATTSLLVQNSAGNTSLQVTDDQIIRGYSATSLRFKLGAVSGGQGVSTRDGEFGIGYTDANNSSGLRFLAIGTGASYIDGWTEGSSKATNYPLFIGSRANNNGGNTTGSTTQENGTQTIFGYAVNEASSLVTINSTTRGFLPPRMTTTQKNAIASPAAGLVVYDSTTNKLCCYNGSTWNDLF